MLRSPIFILVVVAVGLTACGHPENPAADLSPLSCVNVFNGTDLAGNTYPGATVPFGAVQLSPDTEGLSCPGYKYNETTILGFSHTHLSGTGCPDLGDFLVTPGIGEVTPIPFSHKDEEGRPGYYKVDFPSYGIVAELTATAHTGVHRYSFSKAGARLIQVDAWHVLGWTGWCRPVDVSLHLEGTELVGIRRINGWADNRDVYLSAVFSEPFVSVTETEPGRLLFRFADDLDSVELYAGISGVDVEGARKNRLAEAADFETVCAQAEALWEEALSRIRVKGGPVETFYTYFYHTFATPNRIEDIDGRYRDQQSRNRQLPEGRHFYSTLSLWDTFRSWNPLQTLLDTALVNDMVRSMLDDYDCRGELPVWPLASDETGCMIGYHSVPVIADAWIHGIRGYDGEKALEAMIESSNKNNVNASELYNAYGYIPADLKIETVSQTLEFAYDDWCIARMAESLGHADTAAEYDARALRYRNLFDPLTGFFRGKMADGNWTEPFDPLSGSRDYTEATPWQYRFFAPHSIGGIEALMGGRDALYAALDSLFTYAPADQEQLDAGIGGAIGQYAHGNEPSHHMAYLFNWVGAPSRTQEVVRRILTECYSAGPDGICGNEDCGQMGAWYVLASLGLYPVCPGSGEFQFSAPLFQEAVLSLANGNTLTIKADHPEWAYIKRVTMNGEEVRQHFLTYEQIMAGGVLSFQLCSRPDHRRDGLPAPYSLTGEPQACPPAIIGDIVLFPDEAEIRMQSRTEGASIRYTLDGSEPTEASPLYEGPITIRESCTVQARAFLEGLAPSTIVSRTAHKLLFHAASGREGMKPGCRYSYHTANFKLVTQIEGDPAEASGILPEPSIAGAPDEDHFAFVFFGFIDIPEDGVWAFCTDSDDGSALYIDGTVVVNNDGSHSKTRVEGQIPLEKGLHPYKLLYFEDYEGQELDWCWKAPGATDFSPIPADRLFYQ